MSVQRGASQVRQCELEFPLGLVKGSLELVLVNRVVQGENELKSLLHRNAYLVATDFQIHLIGVKMA